MLRLQSFLDGAGLMRAKVCLAMVAALVFGADRAHAVPTFDEVRKNYHSTETVYLDRHGDLIQTLRSDASQRRLEWTPLADISPALRAALILSEDQRFDQHSGVDWQSVGAAAWANLWNTRTRGASTLTMQLASLLDHDLRPRAQGRSLGQKLGQAALAVRLEQTWRKDQILEAYLNLVDFRGEVTGVAALSATLFGKYPQGMTAREAAIAAVLVRSPSAPWTIIAQRACELLKRQGMPDECAGLAEFTQLAFSRKTATRLDPGSNLAPHFARRIMVATGEAEVHTTVDAPLQRFVRTIVHRRLSELAHRHVSDGAVIVLDNQTGDVLAWVGSSGELSDAAEVDGVSAMRQAGSTLKPFLYELALEKRWLTAASLLDDSPVDLTTGSGLYIPQDYDHRFKGLVSLRTALGSSLNVPAVRTLVMVTPTRFHERLAALGFRLRESGDYYGYSLALGSAEVTLATLANAYRTLANDGRSSALRLRKDDPPATFQAVMDPAASFIVTDILADGNARTDTFGLDNVLSTRVWAAVKTGTSKDMRDNWCIGFTHQYTVAVWVGNASGGPMWDVSGVTGAAPIWRAVVEYLQARRMAASLPVGSVALASRTANPTPAGLEHVRVRFEHDIEAERDEWFLAGTQTWHVELAAARRVAKRAILEPAEHTIIALDPDIPPKVQRLQLQAAQGVPNTSAWRIDGRNVASGHTASWPLWPGKHRIELIDAQGHVIDTVQIEVRGANLKGPVPVDSAAG